jgi:hypothetical protein
MERTAAVEGDPVRGKTMDWTWTTGPTASSTHQHTFREDGTMSWRILDGKAEGKTGEEKQYASMQVSPDVWLVSYLAHSGYTITIALNFTNHEMKGAASNDKEWYPLEGSFRVG